MSLYSYCVYTYTALHCVYLLYILILSGLLLHNYNANIDAYHVSSASNVLNILCS